ncbi:hypothetical protein [Sulfolobus sp. S-194]|nr:hypothetical protein [Sulfolobus sp. S-194]
MEGKVLTPQLMKPNREDESLSKIRVVENPYKLIETDLLVYRV